MKYTKSGYGGDERNSNCEFTVKVISIKLLLSAITLVDLVMMWGTSRVSY